jgi:hypothetical protein
VQGAGVEPVTRAVCRRRSPAELPVVAHSSRCAEHPDADAGVLPSRGGRLVRALATSRRGEGRARGWDRTSDLHRVEVALFRIEPAVSCLTGRRALRCSTRP